jgi:hypothetical protein
MLGSKLKSRLLSTIEHDGGAHRKKKVSTSSALSIPHNIKVIIFLIELNMTCDMKPKARAERKVSAALFSRKVSKASKH